MVGMNGLTSCSTFLPTALGFPIVEHRDLKSLTLIHFMT
jgi:hypothetical protein